jgi:hypothetical protein
MKKLLIVLLGVALLASVWVISGWRDKGTTLAQTQSRPDFNQQDVTMAPPTHVTYDLLFKQVIDINQKAAEEKASGQSNSAFQSLRQSFKRRLNLTDEQDMILDEIANECASEAGVIDRQAQEAIQAYWAKYPPDASYTKENLPKHPKELGELQDKHDEIILKYRDLLRQRLGDKEFEKFESSMYLKYGSKIITTPGTSDRKFGGKGVKLER